MGKGGLARAAPFPKSCAQIWAQDSGCSFYNRSNQQNFKNEKFIVDYHMPPRHTARLLNSACLSAGWAKSEAPGWGRKIIGRGKRTIVSAAPAGDENNFEPRETG